MRNEIAGRNEYEDADKKCCNVKEKYQRDVKFHWYFAYIIGLSVEGDDACGILNQNDTQPDDVSKKEALADDKGGKPEEGVSDGAVSCA